MLVLSRKEGESVTIDGNITVTVFRLAGGRVRLGIEAPKDVSILRSELPQWSMDPLDTAACVRVGQVAEATPCMTSTVGASTVG